MRLDLQAGVGPTKLTKEWFVDGTQSDVGTVTFSVVNASGTVVTSGTATKTGTGTTTEYDFNLPIQADPNLLRIRWTRSDTGAYLEDFAEVFASALFIESDARQYTMSGLLAPLGDETAHTDHRLAVWRLLIGDLFESKTGRSWVRRYCRIEAAGTADYRLPAIHGQARTSEGFPTGGPGRIRDVRRIIACTVDGQSVSAGNIKPIDGGFHRLDSVWPPPSPSDPLNVVIEYEYGVEDWEARENALRMLLHNAVPNDISGQAVSFSNDAGTTQLVRDGSWAYPAKVHEWLKRADRRLAIA